MATIAALSSQLSALRLSPADLADAIKVVSKDAAALAAAPAGAEPLSRSYLSGTRAGHRGRPAGMGCAAAGDAELGGRSAEDREEEAAGRGAAGLRGGGILSAVVGGAGAPGSRLSAARRRHLASSSDVLAGLLLSAMQAAKAAPSTPFGPLGDGGGCADSGDGVGSDGGGGADASSPANGAPLGSQRERLAAELRELGLDAAFRVVASKYLQRRLAPGADAVWDSESAADVTRFPHTRRLASGEIAAAAQASLDAVVARAIESQQRHSAAAASAAALASPAAPAVAAAPPASGDGVDEDDAALDGMLDDALDELLG